MRRSPSEIQNEINATGEKLKGLRQELEIAKGRGPRPTDSQRADAARAILGWAEKMRTPGGRR